MAADRLAPAFAPTVNETVPLPLPLAPDVTVIQDAVGTAVHAHPFGAVTVNDPVPPAAGTVMLGGALNVYVQLGAAPAWLTVNVKPAMEIVSERAAPRFGSTRYPTAPSPLPLLGVVNEIHDAVFVAVHVQIVGAVTLMELAPPIAGIDALGGLLMAYVHAGATCVTVNVWPAMVSVPFRGAPPLAATVNETDPLPLPDAPDVTVIHDTLLTAVHGHTDVVVTFTAGTLPPPAATAWVLRLIE